MSKKKILTIAISVALVAILVVGASIAYFTDTDEATNVFTSGSIDIELLEYGKDDQGTLVAFESDAALKELLPNVRVQKIATIKNTGDADAWVWAEILIPQELVSPLAESNETNSALHYNSYAHFNVGYYPGYATTPTNDGILDNGVVTVGDNECVELKADNLWSLPAVDPLNKTVVIDGITYVKFTTKMQSILPAGATALPFLRGAYMDDSVDVARNLDGSIKKDADGNIVYNIPIQNGAGEFDFDYAEYSGSWEIIVRAYGIQATGLASVDAAYTAYNKQPAAPAPTEAP